MSTDNNVIPMKKPGTASTLKAEIERQREELFKAMSLVATTEHALEEDSSERDVLSMAWNIMNDIAGELDAIASPLPEGQPS